MLEERILKRIKNLLVEIRSNVNSKDTEKLKSSLEQMKELQSLVNHCSIGVQKDILLYCFSQLSDMVSINDYQKVHDFADAVHNLPEIFYREYNLNVFWNLYINPFIKKYGKQYFSDYKLYFNGMNDIDWKERRPYENNQH